MQIFLNSFVRKKNFKIYFLSMTLCIIFIFILNMIFQNVLFAISEKENAIANRELIVSTSDTLTTMQEKLQDVVGIQEIYKYLPSIDSVLNIEEEVLNIQLSSGSNEHIPNVILGEKLDVQDSKKILLPSQIKIGKEAIATEKLLNKMLKVKIDLNDNELEYEMKVVGIYETNDKTNNMAYISKIDLSNIVYQDIQNNEEYYSYTIIAEKNTSVEHLIDCIKQKGYEATLYDNSLQKETNILKIVKNIILITLIVIILITYIILYVIISNMLMDEKEDIAILKSIGYKNRNIFIVSCCKTLFLTITSFLLGIMFFFVTMKAIIILCFSGKLISLKISSLNNTLILFINMIIVSIIVNVVSINKIRKISPIAIFYSE